MRIAELNEDSYKYLLWDHQPLTDFWQIGMGKAARLEFNGIHTMGELAAATQENEEWFYKTFGIDAEILIDHAWGIEPVSMADIKNYRSSAHSLSTGQVLPRPYAYLEAKLVFLEMIDVLCADMFAKLLTARIFSYWISYDPITLEKVPDYNGPVSRDFYGRYYPKHTVGNVRFHNRTNSTRQITDALAEQFTLKVDHRFYIRRLGISAEDTMVGSGAFQLDLLDRKSVV